MFYKILYWIVFVCVTLIGVKSKYGSCSGNCTGLIKINNTPPPKKKKLKEGSICWYDGLSCKLNS